MWCTSWKCKFASRRILSCSRCTPGRQQFGGTEKWRGKEIESYEKDRETGREGDNHTKRTEKWGGKEIESYEKDREMGRDGDRIRWRRVRNGYEKGMRRQ